MASSHTLPLARTLGLTCAEDVVLFAGAVVLAAAGSEGVVLLLADVMLLLAGVVVLLAGVVELA